MHKSLIWNGTETINLAKQLVEERSDIKVKLPPDFHHALFTHLYPDANAGQIEKIDIVGGPEVLEKIAKIRGLEAMATLIQPLAERGAEIHLVSPSPSIEIHF